LVIYGVAILAVCMIAGLFLGDLLGRLIGLEANVGGVGIAMLLMILLADHLRKKGKLHPLTSQGILFWSSIYIPVVVAMAAKQNVIAAVRGGPAAILAGVSAVAVGFLLVPLVSRIGSAPVPAPNPGGSPGAPQPPDEPLPEDEPDTEAGS
jgi:malonate transporter MadL subunit